MISSETERVNEVAERYLNGETCAEIALDYSVSPGTIASRLKRHAVATKIIGGTT